MRVRFVERELFIEDIRHELQFPIDDAFEQGGLVVVLFDPDSPADSYRPFHNLVAVDSDGRVRWEAELPTSNPGDRYYKISSHEPLVAYSTQSYDCVIDISTGRIVSKEFTK
jgi:hypothetical protein